MTPFAIVAVFVGAGIGACLRYAFNVALNPVLPDVPMGTLASNLIGGYLVGAAAAWFLLRTELPPEYRLFVITGFLGGLTTFSAFSLEVVTLIEGDRPGLALLTMAAHVLGSLALTALGALSVRTALT